MRFLLTGFESSDLFVPVILLVTIVVAIFISLALKRMEKLSLKKHKVGQMPKKINLTLNKQYMTKQEYNFLTVLHKALPAEFIAFPKVSLAVLLNPVSDKVSYNLVEKHYVDICIFLKETMEPVLVVDLLQTEASIATFREITPIVREALGSVKLGIVDVRVQSSYDLKELRKTIISSLPSELIIKLKEDIFKEFNLK